MVGIIRSEVIYYIILYYNILYYIILYLIWFYHTILYYIILYFILLYIIINYLLLLYIHIYVWIVSWVSYPKWGWNMLNPSRVPAEYCQGALLRWTPLEHQLRFSEGWHLDQWKVVMRRKEGTRFRERLCCS
jgi:hypothetical protein